jgi:hypothetical protein
MRSRRGFICPYSYFCFIRGSLMPAAFALLGIGLSRAKRQAIVVIAPIVLLSALPSIYQIAPLVLPHGLGVGVFTVEISDVFRPILALIAGCILARFAAKQAFGTAAALAGLGFVWFQFATFPQFDALASTRPLWLAEHPQCAPAVSRDILYGLYYYSGRQISACPVLDRSATRVVR